MKENIPLLSQRKEALTNLSHIKNSKMYKICIMIQITLLYCRIYLLYYNKWVLDICWAYWWRLRSGKVFRFLISAKIIWENWNESYAFENQWHSFLLDSYA